MRPSPLLDSAPLALRFTVVGVAQPQGSMRAFLPRRSRWPVVTSDNPQLSRWRRDVARGAAAGMAGRPPYDGPVQLVATFYLPRPQRLNKHTRPHVTRPDLDKLTRAVGDALTGVVYLDDAQVTVITAAKRYVDVGADPRADVEVIG